MLLQIIFSTFFFNIHSEINLVYDKTLCCYSCCPIFVNIKEEFQYYFMLFGWVCYVYEHITCLMVSKKGNKNSLNKKKLNIYYQQIQCSGKLINFFYVYFIEIFNLGL